MTSTTAVAGDAAAAAADNRAPRVATDHFGGPFGAVALTFVLPLIVFYLHATIAQHDASLWLPRSLAEFTAILPAPTLRGFLMYGMFFVLHAFLFAFAPGKLIDGAQLPDGSRLPYKMNGLSAFLITAAVLIGLLATGSVRASDIIAELGPMITISTLLTLAFSIWFYFWGRQRGARERSSGNIPYDFFMGTVLNPRLRLFDFKFFLESRMGMAAWGALVVVMPFAEYEHYGHVSLAMGVVTFCQLWYIVDFFVFESNLLSMLDIIYENFGFMLTFGCVVWIPFTFALQQRYLLVQPHALPWYAAVGVVVLHFVGYTIFRDSNLQKQRFRQDPTRNVWGKPPKFMQTKRGTKLLLSGWWGLSRHSNYLGDLTMALSWCLTCGFLHVVPYFYFIYFAPLLVNRERRDHALCKEKYGADWDEYCKKVPYRIIPFVF